VRTLPVFSLHELAETYLKKRIKPVGRADRDNIKKVFALLCAWLIIHYPGVDLSTFTAEHLEEFLRYLVTLKNTKGEYDDRNYINKLIGFVKGVFNWCARRKHSDGYSKMRLKSIVWGSSLRTKSAIRNVRG